MTESQGMSINKKTLDNKLFIQETSRPLSTVTYFTSQGDDMSNPTKVGGGDFIKVVHIIGDPLEQSMIIDFNMKENKTYLHEGYLVWKNCDFDAISLEVVPNVTIYSSGTNTNFNLYGGYMIVPANGNGTIDVQTQDMKLVEIPLSRDTGLRKQAFWNADYSKVTHTFSNITPAPLGDGVYNLFTVPVTLSRFVNKILLINSGWLMLQTADVDELCHGMRLKFKAFTDSAADHDWKVSIIMTMNREKNC